jgi:hypothetical protein
MGHASTAFYGRFRASRLDANHSQIAACTVSSATVTT